MDHVPHSLVLYRVETDDQVKGDFGTLQEALEIALPEEYIVQVTYKEIRNDIIKRPNMTSYIEIKRGEWIVLTGQRENISDETFSFVLDASLLDLSQKQKKRIMEYVEYIYVTYPDYIPFRSTDEITHIVLQRSKYGVRQIIGNDKTEWTIFNTQKEAKAYAKTLDTEPHMFHKEEED